MGKPRVVWIWGCQEVKVRHWKVKSGCSTAHGNTRPHYLLLRLEGLGVQTDAGRGPLRCPDRVPIPCHLYRTALDLVSSGVAAEATR